MSVSLSGYGNFLAVGDPFSDANGTRSGQVRVYNLDDNTNLWVPVGNAIVGPSEEKFGRDVQLSGYPSSSGGFSGDAYLAVLGNYRARVYKYSSSTVSWEQLLTDLTATGAGWSSPGFIDSFSAYLPSQVTLSSSQGYIHMYTWTTNIYSNAVYEFWGAEDVIPKLSDPNGYSKELVTSTPMSSGRRVAVGYSARDAVGANSGQVRVYDVSLSSHSQVGSSIDGKAKDDYFGTEVSMTTDGTRIAVGAAGYPGYVQVLEYRESPNAWVQLGEDISNVGYQVSLEKRSGEIIAVTTSNSVMVFRYGGAPSPPPHPPPPNPPPTTPPPSSSDATSLNVCASSWAAVGISLMLAY